MLNRIKEDDRMIQNEGVDSLSEAELRQACRERGMLGLRSVEDMRKQVFLTILVYLQTYQSFEFIYMYLLLCGARDFLSNTYSFSLMKNAMKSMSLRFLYIRSLISSSSFRISTTTYLYDVFLS